MTTSNGSQSLTIEELICQAESDGHVAFRTTRGAVRILYVASNRSERWTDPEEKVRAATFLDLVYRLGYPPERIGFEVTIPRRKIGDKADLVVFTDDEQKAPYIVIECKRDGISDKEFEQAVEQACGYRANLSAQYAVVVSGLSRRVLDFRKAKSLERNRNRVADLPVRYGKPPEWRYLRGVQGSDLAPVSRDALRTLIGKCHQTLWEAGKRSPIEAFDEFCKIVFVKVQDEKAHAKQGSPYDFQRKTDETNEQLRNRIVALYASEQKRDPEVFQDSIKVGAAPLATLVEHIESINLSKTDLDTKGMAFEAFMGSFFKGDFGQYFTPRDLIRFCVEALSPQTTDRVLDPACGSGGFLLHSLDHVRHQADETYPSHNSDPDQSSAHYRMWHDFAQNNLFGIEINEQLARVAKMNMIIHDDGHTNVLGHDALDFFDHLTAERKGLAPASFDLVLSNPPFGALIRSTEKGDDYVAQYDLRFAVSRTRNPADKAAQQQLKADIKTEILFLERIHSFLKPGTGRAAIIVPEGILNNASLRPVRRWMLNHFQINAVVSLPEHAFSHYNANVLTSVLFVRRLSENESAAALANSPVLMATATTVGYDSSGKSDYQVTIESQTPESIVVRHSSDLYSTRVHMRTLPGIGSRPRTEIEDTEVVPDTGLLGIWHRFRKAVAARSDSFLLEGVSDGAAYVARLGDLETRMDTQFNHPEHLALLDALEAEGAVPLSSVIDFSEAHWVPSTHPEQTFNYFEIGGVDRKRGRAYSRNLPVADAPSRARMAVAPGDILVSLTRPDRGAIAILGEEADSCVASTGFSVLRNVDQSMVVPEYLWYALRSETSRQQMYYRQSGGNYPAITEEELGRIRLLLPSLPAQEEILAKRRLLEARIQGLLDEIESLEAELLEGL